MTDFGGDNAVLGGIQQAETALEMDRVCQYVGGCDFVVGKGLPSTAGTQAFQTVMSVGSQLT